MRYLLLLLTVLSGAAMAGPGDSAPRANQASSPSSQSGTRLPGDSEHIPAGIGTNVPPQIANRTHHVRRQEALQHAQGVIASREQLRADALAGQLRRPDCSFF